MKKNRRMKSNREVKKNREMKKNREVRSNKEMKRNWKIARELSLFKNFLLLLFSLLVPVVLNAQTEKLPKEEKQAVQREKLLKEEKQAVQQEKLPKEDKQAVQQGKLPKQKKRPPQSAPEIPTYRLVLDPGHGGAPVKRKDDRWDPVTGKYLSFYNYGSSHKGYEEHKLALALAKRLKRYLDLTLTAAGWRSFKQLLKAFSQQNSFSPLRFDAYLTRYDNWKNRGLDKSHRHVNAPYRLFDFPDPQKKGRMQLGRLSKINRHRPYLLLSLHMTKAGRRQPGGMAAVLAPGYKTLNTLRRISLGKLPRSHFHRMNWQRYWLVTEKGWSRYEAAHSDTWVYFHGFRTHKARLKPWRRYNRGFRHNFIHWRYADRRGWELAAKKQQQPTYSLNYRRYRPLGPFWERERGQPEAWRREGGALGFGGDNHYAGDELLRFVQYGVPLIDPQMRSKGAIVPIQPPFVSVFALPIYTNAITAMLEIGYINRWKDRRLLSTKLDPTARALAAGIYSLFRGLQLRHGSGALKPRGKPINWKKYEKRPQGNYFQLAAGKS